MWMLIQIEPCCFLLECINVYLDHYCLRIDGYGMSYLSCEFIANIAYTRLGLVYYILCIFHPRLIVVFNIVTVFSKMLGAKNNSNFSFCSFTIFQLHFHTVAATFSVIKCRFPQLVGNTLVSSFTITFNKIFLCHYQQCIYICLYLVV